MKSFIKLFKGAGWLNILGMSAALAAIYIIMVQVNYDMSFNRSIKDSERIFAVAHPSWVSTEHYMLSSARPYTEPALAQSTYIEQSGMVAATCPEVRVTLFQESSKKSEFKAQLFRMNRNAMDMLGYEATQGSFQEMDHSPIVAVSERFAVEVGARLGDVLKVLDDESVYTVGAIFKNMPVNSELDEIDLFYCNGLDSEHLNDQNVWGFRYYVKLHAAEDKEAFETEANLMINRVFKDNVGTGEMDKFTQMKLERANITLLPITELHYNTEVDFYRFTADKTSTLVLLTIAGLILVISFINYINFFLAQVPLRLKSVNTRKILGSSRISLILEFLYESGRIVVVALLGAAVFVSLLKDSPYMELLSCSIDFANNGAVVLLTIVLAMVMMIVSSLYPAYYITSFPPMLALKGSMGHQKGSSPFQYALLTFQFIVALIFVICATMFKVQYNYMMDYDMGFNRSLVYSLKLEDSDISAELLMEELKKNPMIQDATACSSTLVSSNKNISYVLDGDYEYTAFQIVPNFLRFMGIEVVEGRDFEETDLNSTTPLLLFNEMSKAQLELTLDKEVGNGRVIGFCKNFHFQPLQFGMTPYAFEIVKEKASYDLPMQQVYFRTIREVPYQELKAMVTESVSHVSPGSNSDAFILKDFEDEIAAVYQKQKNDQGLVTMFSLLSIVIALMGVVGLLLFETTYRRKEIGIRRVHGAEISEILLMFNRKFIYILLVSFAIAAPVSYYVMDYYYSTFAYRAPMQAWIFAFAFLIVLVITVFVITLCTYRTAAENPSESLKTE